MRASEAGRAFASSASFPARSTSASMDVVSFARSSWTPSAIACRAQSSSTRSSRVSEVHFAYHSGGSAFGHTTRSVLLSKPTFLAMAHSA
ncbi:MAG: hypothetical protein ACYTKD_01675 [Planctomycetota bacterium]|jgi:hypothetical protein